MNENTLPQSVVAEDRQLDAKREQAQEALARHRWHWTLDESNPDRVSFVQYAKQVGISRSTVAKYANGYRDWGATDSSTSLEDAIVYANMNAETALATAAVAEQAGVKPSSVDRAGQYRTEVKEVVNTARDRAERNQTTVEEEIPKVAEWRAKARKAENARKEEQKKSRTANFIAIEGDLVGAKIKLRKALDRSMGADMDEEEVALLRTTYDQLLEIIKLIGLRFDAQVDVDWDAELAALEA